jgi:hypothetical protein
MACTVKKFFDLALPLTIPREVPASSFLAKREALREQGLPNNFIDFDEHPVVARLRE